MKGNIITGTSNLKPRAYPDGYIAILTTILVSAVALVTALSVGLLAIGEAQSSFHLYNGETTLQLVEGCAEDALSQARVNKNYSSNTLIHPEGRCAVTITKNGNIWTITVTNAAYLTPLLYQRTIQVVFTRKISGITLSSWKEI